MAKKQDAFGFPSVDLRQEHVSSFLDACRRGTIPPLLFTGAAGVGKEHVAIDFARRACCREQPSCALDGTLCESCRKALELEHPGINLIYPTPTQGTGEKAGDDEAEIAKILDEKRQDFFDTYRFTKKVSIRIARARAIIQRANTKPFNSPYNVFILHDAHAMREEAQNALLKLVEEPPSQCILIFITPNPDAILYTIRSRCQRVRFTTLKPDVIEALLVDYYGIEPKQAAKAALLSQGSVQRARQVAAEFDDEERATAYEVLTHLPEASRSWLVGTAMTVARGRSRDSVARFLHEFAVACRDLMTEDEGLFINKDQTALLSRELPKWDRRRLPEVLDRIIDTRDGILRRNLNIEASLADLFLDIKHVGC